MKVIRLVCALIASITLTANLTGCHSARDAVPADLCSATNNAFSDALGRVSSGSEPDITSAARSLSCLDGGNLEDAHIALGEAVFKFPKRIVPLLQSTGIGSSDLIAMATMLPSEYVDEPCKSRDELTKRRLQVTRESVFGFERAIVLQQLDSSIAKENKWCKDAK